MKFHPSTGGSRLGSSQHFAGGVGSRREFFVLELLSLGALTFLFDLARDPSESQALYTCAIAPNKPRNQSLGLVPLLAGAYQYTGESSAWCNQARERPRQ